MTYVNITYVFITRGGQMGRTFDSKGFVKGNGERRMKLLVSDKQNRKENL